MKKIISLLIAAALALAPSCVFAEDEIKVLINGEAVEFDVPPQIINDRTMVPMRKIYESLGASVEWIDDGKLIFATRDSDVFVMGIGSTIFSITNIISSESKTLELDAAPVIIDGRTLVPARAVSEALNMNVDWDAETKSVIITNK